MASNFSSYTPSYSSPYYQHHSPYSGKSPHYSRGHESIRSRSLSYNDLSSHIGPQGHQNYIPRTPVSHYVPTFYARNQFVDTQLRGNMPLNQAQPKAISSPSLNPTTAPTTLSRYRGRHARTISAGSLEGKQNVYQQNHHQKTYNASVSSSEISVDSESLRTQTSISSADSGDCWQEDEAKSATKITRGQSTPDVAQIGKVGPEILKTSTLKLNVAPEAPLGGIMAPEPSSPATIKGGAIDYTDSTPTKQSIHCVSAKSVTRTGDEIRAVNSSSANHETSRASHELVLPSDQRRNSLHSSLAAFQYEKIPSSVSKSSSLPALSRLSLSGEICNDGSMQRNPYSPFAESRESPTADCQSLSPLPPSPALLHEKPKSSSNASLASSLPSSSATSLQNLPPTQENAQVEPLPAPTVRKARSFGSKLKNLLSGSNISSRSKSNADDDTRSIMSSKSTFSIKSSSSMFSISGRFGRKKKDLDDFVPSVKSDVSQEYRLLSEGRPTGSFAPTQRAGLLSPSTDSVHDTQRPTRSAQNLAPRPPSPALRSEIGYFQETSRQGSPPIKSAKSAVSRSVKTPSKAVPSEESMQSGKREQLRKVDLELAPSNMAAGDIYPGDLKKDSLEIIVSSVERTGSFKRQPSTKTRSTEEVVPHPQKIESDVKRTPSVKRPKASSMKRSHGQSVRRRSGASDATSVSFASQILVYKTYSASAYDRTPDRMTCDMLSTPGVAQRLREELNQWKSLMEVHPESRRNTQFFQF